MKTSLVTISFILAFAFGLANVAHSEVNFQAPAKGEPEIQATFLSVNYSNQNDSVLAMTAWDRWGEHRLIYYKSTGFLFSNGKVSFPIKDLTAEEAEHLIRYLKKASDQCPIVVKISRNGHNLVSVKTSCAID